MTTNDKRRIRADSFADALNGMDLSPNELFHAKARMAQAETIANAMVAVFNGIAAAGVGVRNGFAALTRRVRTMLMKPAHH